MVWRVSMILCVAAMFLMVGAAPADDEKGPGKGPGKGGPGGKGGFGKGGFGKGGPGGFGGFGGKMDPAKMAEQLVSKFDTDKDGKLDAKELAAALKSLQESGGMGGFGGPGGFGKGGFGKGGFGKGGFGKGEKKKE